MPLKKNSGKYNQKKFSLPFMRRGKYARSVSDKSPVGQKQAHGSPLLVKFKAYKRQILTAAALAAIVYVFAAIGILSYLQSNDTVTNRIISKNGSVTLYEPHWDSTGQYKAKKSEPGMTIEKDPYAVNNGQIDIYTRLKVTVRLGGNSSVSNADRLAAILKAIKYKNDNNEYVPLFTESSGVWSCSNSKYYLVGFTINNSNDYLIMYFFYTNGDNENHMQIVSPDESTPVLFDRVDIPIYKKDYLGIFDKPYDIYVEAQAVPASDFTDIPKADNTEFRQKWSD